MDRAMRRRETAGITLVELLVVLGVIAIISAVTIPVAIQGGWFTPSQSAFAARELFTLEKAARVYASTYNVETAVAYGVELVPDTQLSDSRLVPVATEVALARRLKREELIRENLACTELGLAPPFVDLDNDYFVPLSAEEGVFRTIPKQMCVLPDLFEVDDIATPVSTRGLMGVQMYDVSAHQFIEPRYYDFGSGAVPMNYSVDGDTPNFPAHRFFPDGSVRKSDAFTMQRFTIRVGARPDALFKDRFTVSSDSVPGETPIVALFYSSAGADPIINTLPPIVYTDPGANNLPAEIDTSLEFFVPTGRVKMVP